jgi:hypothetical protein
VDGNFEALRARLDIIEVEVRRIADSLSLLVRVDERLLNLQTQHNDMEARLRAVETKQGGTSLVVGAWEKLWWIIAAGAMGLGFTMAKDRWAPPPPAPVTISGADQRKDGP